MSSTLFENIFIPVAEYRGILKRKKIRGSGIDTPICVFQYHIIFFNINIGF